MGIGSTLGAALWLFALAGVAAAGACYLVIPWERVVDEDEAPEGVPIVRLTRLGTTGGALSLVLGVVSGWLVYAETMAGLKGDLPGQSPTLLERVALVAPVEVLLGASLVGALLAPMLPVWAGIVVRARAAVAARGEP